MIKPIVLLFALGVASCSYVDPQRSKALSEEKQTALMQSQDTLLREQNKQLAKIANALEKLTQK